MEKLFHILQSEPVTVHPMISQHALDGAVIFMATRHARDGTVILMFTLRYAIQTYDRKRSLKAIVFLSECVIIEQPRQQTAKCGASSTTV